MISLINGFLKDNSPLFAGLFGLAFIYLGIGFISRIEKEEGGTDFNIYYQAGKLINEGNIDNLYSFTTGRAWHYCYPPLFALFFSPLSRLPLRAAGLVWYILNLVFILCSLKLLLRLRGDEAFLPLALAVIYGAGAIITNLIVGQANILIAFLIVLFFILIERERGFAAGFLIALASAIKIIPVIFFFYFFLKPKKRLILGGVFGFFIFLIIIPSLFFGVKGCFSSNIQFAREMILPHLGVEMGDTIYFLKSDINNTANQSLYAVSGRGFAAEGKVFPSVNLASLSPGWHKLAVSLVQFLLFFLTAFFILLKRKKLPLLELSLFIPLMFLLSPVIKPNQLPPLAIAVFFLAGDGMFTADLSQRHRISSVIFFILSLISLTLIVMGHLKIYGAGLAGVFFLWLALSLALIGMKR